MPQVINSEIFCSVESIHGFRDLFRSEQSRGINFGSTMLLSGPPGAGKTTFALAMVRTMMAEAKNKQCRDKEKIRTIAYYISSEVHEEHLKKNFKDFGWFAGDQEESRFKFQMTSSEPDAINFYAITPMPEVDRPVPSPEELVNGIFNRISHTLLPSEAPTEPAVIYVIVDSISALLKGASGPGEERRQTHEIIRRLNDRFGKEYLALILLLAESDHQSRDLGDTVAPLTPTAPSVEDYLADVVFRLYVRSLPLGRRSRILEVVKSQGVNMVLGEHTWQIVTEGYASEIFRADGFRDQIKGDYLYHDSKEAEPPAIQDETKWGGIVIFPRPTFQQSKKDPQPQKPNASGGVRESLSADGQSDPRRRTGTEGLHLDVGPGTVTLIAGPMGCGKTSLCKQFLTFPRDREKDNPSGALISFDVSETPDKEDDRYLRLDFTQSQFDLNVLVAHIKWILAKGCDRLAFDGLSEWVTTFGKSEAARVLEALMLTVKKRREVAVFMTYEMPHEQDPLGPAALGAPADNLVVIRMVPIKDVHRRVIYVLKEKENEKGGVSGTSNTLSLRHPGELVRLENGKYEVNRTKLEAYTGLLSGAVQPAQVLIQLFEENSAEALFNRRLVSQLKQQYARRIRLTHTSFSVADLGTTLQTAFGYSKPSEAHNLAIHAVDEWWLKTTETERFLRDLCEDKGSKQLNYQDFWWFEVEKGLGKSPTQIQEPNQRPRQACYAVPGYMDFGMFCINLDAIDKDQLSAINTEARLAPKTDSSRSTKLRELDVEKRMREAQRKRWKVLLNRVPRVWADRVTMERGKEKLEWFACPDTTVLGYALKLTAQDKAENLSRRAIFTFDSSTRETSSCMFFELAWAFGAKESFLDGSQVAFAKADMAAVKRALLFLQYMVLEGLMAARCSSHSPDHAGRPVLFSRQWYSTLQKQFEDSWSTHSEQMPEADGASKKSDESKDNDELKLPGGLVSLPFMPVGVPDSGKEAIAESLIDDIAVRQKFWTRRAKRLLEVLQSAISEKLKRLRDKGRPTEDLEKDLDKLKKFDLREIESFESDFETADKPEHLKSRLTAKWKAITKAYSNSRSWLLNMSKLSLGEELPPATDPTNWAADLDDLIELASWAGFRLRLMSAQEKGSFPPPNAQGPVAQAFRDMQWIRHALPDLSNDLQSSFAPDNAIPTGYVCSGSWLYGVGADSQSSEIQTQILGELSSLPNALERAKGRAGMPVRKDFFYLHGGDPVKGMEYLNWRELLRYSASRSRRRDRVLLSSGDDLELNDPSPLYSMIQNEILNCLRFADLNRQKYAESQDERVKEVIAETADVADQAMKRIFNSAAEIRPKNQAAAASGP
jgi:KaiC/GvpD/RAD55 family RecA-like ATPase